jgi:hypothetical protein
MRGTRIEKDFRNLCYEPHQQNQEHEHQCKEMGGKNCEDSFIVKNKCKYKKRPKQCPTGPL